LFFAQKKGGRKRLSKKLASSRNGIITWWDC